MKVFVVEDEGHIRQGLVSTLQGLGYEVVGQAQNGLEGFDAVLETTPDVLITDIRLPEKNGLVMLQELREHGFNGYAIILTGYQDFEYARIAVRLRASEYLLKPVTVEELSNSLQVIKGSLETKESHSIEDTLEEFLLEEEVSSSHVEALKMVMQLNDTTEMTVFLFSPRSKESRSFTGVLQAIPRKVESFYYEKYYLIPLENKNMIILICVNTNQNKSLEKNMAHYVLEPLWEITPCVASSRRMFSLESLPKQVKCLEELLLYSLVFPPKELIIKELVGKLSFSSADYPTNLEEQMRRAMLTQNKKAFYQVKDSFEGVIKRENILPNSFIENTIRFLLATVASKREIVDLPEELSLNKAIYSLWETYEPDVFLSIYGKIMDLLAPSESEIASQNVIILQAVEHIRRHYGENPSLSELADIVKVSPEYLSRLFLQEMDLNYSTFIKKFRMSHAKRLILLGEYPLGEIAKLVGYPDQKYFSRVFKEEFGVTPSEYRKNNLKEDYSG